MVFFFEIILKDMNMSKLGHIVATAEDAASALEADENFSMSAEVTDTISDMDSDINSIEGTENAVSDAMDSVDQLSEVSETVAEGGPITDTEIAVVESLHASVLQRLGLDQHVLTTESRSTLTRQRLVSTLEDSKGGIVSKIVSALKAAISMVTGFISGLLQNRTLLRKYLEGIKAKVGDYDDEKDVKTVDAKFKSASHVNDAFKNCDELIDFSEEYVKAFSPFVQNPDKLFNPVTGKNQGAVIELLNAEHLENSNYAGGQQLIVYEEEDDNSPTKLEMKAGATAVTEGARLSKAECSSIIDAALKTLKDLDRVQKYSNTAVYLLKQMINMIVKKASDVGARLNHLAKNAEGVTRNVIRGVNTTVASIIRKGLQRVTTRVPSIVFKQIKAAGDYVRASL